MTPIALRTATSVANLVETGPLTADRIQRLAEGVLLAIRLPNFISKESCHHIASRFASQESAYYDYADGVVGRFGMSFSEIGPSLEKREQYYKEAKETLGMIRECASPHPAPIDTLRVMLEEEWPHRAMLETFHQGRTPLVGLCRTIAPHKLVYPHQDMLAWDAEDVPDVKDSAFTLINQLACNVYLSLPHQGGELELWDWGEHSKTRYLEMSKGSYGVNKELIGLPIVTLKPQLGEAILFAPTKFHSISPGDVLRLSASCFIGYRGKNQPLTYWS